MRILVLSSRIPYPLVGGDRKRVYYISKILATRYHVDLLAINENRAKREELKALDEIFDNLILFDFNLTMLKANALKNLFSRKPIQVGGYYFETIQRWIDKHFKKYDLVYCNHIRTAEYARRLPCKKVLDFHDAISMNYKDALRMAKGFWKVFYFIEDKRLLPYELEVLQDFDKYFITSQADKDYLLANTSMPADIKVIAMGVDENVLRRSQNVEEENWIVFLGKMNYYPNEDAAVYFARQVFPLLRSKLKDVKFIIVGAYPTRRVQALSKIPGVEITGFVDDPYEYLGRAKVVVAPIRLGAGIQNKILEAMALRKPVVTTSKGARGIAGGADGKHFVVADDPEKMAEKILELLNDPERRREIGQNARALIEERYTWDAIGVKLLAEIEKVI
mgnify:CR=1 FL=1